MQRKTRDLEARIQYVGYCATPAEVNQDAPWDETRSDLDESFPGLLVRRGITPVVPAATPDITLTLRPGIARPEAMALVLKMLDFIETPQYAAHTHVPTACLINQIFIISQMRIDPLTLGSRVRYHSDSGKTFIAAANVGEGVRQALLAALLSPVR